MLIQKPLYPVHSLFVIHHLHHHPLVPVGLYFELYCSRGAGRLNIRRSPLQFVVVDPAPILISGLAKRRYREKKRKKVGSLK